jgi:aspartyl-tRNA(Asn)/glutamyl-tRNA(Gln) amidotransferase subunit A
LTVIPAFPPLGLTDLSAEYSSGARDPATVLRTCLDRIVDHDRAIGAVIGLDESGARAGAAASARRWRRGAPRSVIDGMPLLVKANIAVAGMPWHAGIRAYEDRIAASDAPCIARLRAAGAVIMGMTNMDEAALGGRGENPWFGTIANPHKPGVSAGGSSGGSAAAVAAGFCAAALGSDTIGSITIPAAFCGVVGHRASRSVLPTDGVVALSPTLDHLGWHTRSVADSALLLKTTGGAKSDAAIPRIAALALEGLDVVPAVAQAFHAVVERVRFAGFRVDTLHRGAPIRTLARLLFEIAEIEAACVHASMLAAHPDGFSPALGRMLAWGSGRGAALYPDHLAMLADTGRDLQATFAGHDAVIMPTTPRPAFALDAPTPEDQALFSALPACLGWSATAVPVGRHDGLPLSAMVIGRDDSTCLGAAALLARD